MNQTSCKSYRPMISEFVDGALSNEQTWKVQMHLSVCTECAEFAHSLEQTVSLLKRVPTPELSSGFDASLAARLAAVADQRQAALKAPKPIRWLNTLRAALSFPSMTTGERLRMSAPIAVASLMIGFLALAGPANVVTTNSITAPATDAGFAIACVHQSHTYLSGQPFADPSAQALMQRQADDSLVRAGANLLGDGKL